MFAGINRAAPPLSEHVCHISIYRISDLLLLRQGTPTENTGGKKVNIYENYNSSFTERLSTQYAMLLLMSDTTPIERGDLVGKQSALHAELLVAAAHLIVVDSEVGLLDPEVPLYHRPALEPYEQLHRGETQGVENGVIKDIGADVHQQHQCDLCNFTVFL